MNFYSQNNIWQVSSMSTIEPIKVNRGTDLSFWCWYEIDNWDYAFVEVSRDARIYDIIDSFTGISKGWIYKTYSLKNYEDESIFIRFRYTTKGINKGRRKPTTRITTPI